MAGAPRGDEPARKRIRYSREADLDVVVEDETFRMCSFVLISASDVFAQMLESGMRESEEGRIRLEGKSKTEFQELRLHLDLRRGAAPPGVTDQNVQMLLRWADEYQIDGLTQRCEKFLLDKFGDIFRKPDPVDTLRLAVEYRMQALQKKCSNVIAGDVYKYREALPQFSEEPTVMSIALPSLFKAAGLQPSGRLGEATPMPKEYWPLVLRALEAMYGWSDFEEKEAYVAHKQAMEKELLEFIPKKLDIRGPIPIGVDSHELRKQFGYRFGEDLLHAVLDRLCKKGSVRKHASGRYWRDWCSPLDHLPLEGLFRGAILP